MEPCRPHHQRIRRKEDTPIHGSHKSGIRGWTSRPSTGREEEIKGKQRKKEEENKKNERRRTICGYETSNRPAGACFTTIADGEAK